MLHYIYNIEIHENCSNQPKIQSIRAADRKKKKKPKLQIEDTKLQSDVLACFKRAEFIGEESNPMISISITIEGDL